MKGSANCSSFATGKFALRALSQSLAREFGPKGVHVSHIIVDGVIDIERTKGWHFDAPDAKISPNAVRPLRHQRGLCLHLERRSQTRIGIFTPSHGHVSPTSWTLGRMSKSGSL